MAATTTPTMNTYISDLLALEQHIAQPLEHQAKDKDVLAQTHASRVINDAFELCHEHVDALEKRLQTLGGHAGSPVKSSVASVLGGAAAAVGTMRKTEVSKYLRDDYAALCLASAGYTMLHTTALALGDAATAKLAQKHLADCATIVMQISSTLPVLVLGELRAEGVAIDASVASEAERNVENAWKDGGARSSN